MISFYIFYFGGLTQKQTKMKTIQLNEVVKYVNSDKWLAQEVSGRLLMTSITFVSFDKEFIKVFKVRKKKGHKYDIYSREDKKRRKKKLY